MYFLELILYLHFYIVIPLTVNTSGWKTHLKSRLGFFSVCLFSLFNAAAWLIAYANQGNLYLNYAFQLRPQRPMQIRIRHCARKGLNIHYLLYTIFQKKKGYSPLITMWQLVKTALRQLWLLNTFSLGCVTITRGVQWFWKRHAVLEEF